MSDKTYREETIEREKPLESSINTGVYLSVLQYERLKTMAAADSRSASNFIGLLIDEAWNRYLKEKEDSPHFTEKEAV